MLTVYVEDINDNAPKFVKKNFQTAMLETSVPGQFLMFIQARDDDIGENARLTYSIEENEHFSMETDQKRNKGLLILKKVNDSLIVTTIDIQCIGLRL